MSDVNLQEVFNELQKDSTHPEDVMDNKSIFPFDNVMHRVRMPNQQEVAKANSLRNEKFVELIQNKNCLTIKRLTQVLKDSQDIDIAKMDEEIKEVETKMQDTYLSLAKCKDSEEKMIEKMINEIKELTNKKMELIIEKAGYLAPAIENQAQDTYYHYLTATCTEVMTEDENEEWKRVWKSMDEYGQDESKLPYIALGKISELMMGV